VVCACCLIPLLRQVPTRAENSNKRVWPCLALRSMPFPFIELILLKSGRSFASCAFLLHVSLDSLTHSIRFWGNGTILFYLLSYAFPVGLFLQHF
jgi:hypothetical protein